MEQQGDPTGDETYVSGLDQEQTDLLARLLAEQHGLPGGTKLGPTWLVATPGEAAVFAGDTDDPDDAGRVYLFTDGTYVHRYSAEAYLDFMQAVVLDRFFRLSDLPGHPDYQGPSSDGGAAG